ncbi:MAG: SUF system Fe-S cluster assembly regulator [Alphaproteobacteria bacterium]|nr:SUF system Fe-S cluster assembly regulator [Alphaproteobacteria bacterium]MDP6818049.1 SUF system Fe-S cluster assembly regulator [Alphaproteobacteria bacterium]
MIRISRMADYGVVALSFMARDPQAFFSAATVAERTGVPLPSASKLLKLLVKGNVLVSRRGAAGGYGLARPPEAISVADLVVAVDGPIAIADCLEGGSGGVCDLEGFCAVRGPWQKVSDAIRVALEELTLADIAGSFPGQDVAARTGATGALFSPLNDRT